MSAVTAKTLIEDLLLWDIVPIDGDIILMAIDLQIRHVFSFRDALIISAALHGGACRLLSEDLQDGRNVDGLTIENPFR
jgi:predicted nucleic acid-binding protein